MSSPMLPKDTAWSGKKAFTSLLKLRKIRASSNAHPLLTIPPTAPERLADPSSKTILYLAYGSNLSAETFKGTRGIKPISSINAHIPSLSLTFDLSGIPYTEPCFANTKYRDPANDFPKDGEYHKDRWHKGLIGVVYEVTLEDFRTIIATEGGGANYQDIVVPCYPLAPGGTRVDPHPSGTPFQAHTLLRPRDSSETLKAANNSKGTDRIQRPDPSYAQPSARYLKLITDGAEEHSLPSEYLAFLYNIRPYTITTIRQRIGQGLFLVAWTPILLAMILLSRCLADEEGKMPEWVARLLGVSFNAVWWSYDKFFKRVFGDGERTIGNGGDEEMGLKE